MAIGMLSKIISGRIVIFNNMYKIYKEIINLCRKRKRIPNATMPRRRVRYDPFLESEKMKAAYFVDRKLYK